jgi:two-component system, OmpR family, sensor kinase
VPIRFRLAASVSLVTCVLFVVVGFLFLRSFRHGLETSKDPGLRSQAQALINAVTTDGEALDLRTGAAGIPSTDTVAQVVTRGGEVVTSTREAGSAPVLNGRRLRAVGEEARFFRAEVGSEREPFRVLARAVPADPSRVVVLASSLEDTDIAVDRVRNAVLVGGAFAVVATGVGAWLLAAAALRPVERMRREAADISEHDRTSRLEVPSTRDEIAALGITMNELLARLQGALSRERAFVADAGHELRTPLALLSTELELARRSTRTQEELRESIVHAGSATERLERLVDELLFLAREQQSPVVGEEPVPVVMVVEQSVAAFRGAAEVADVTLAVHVDQSVELLAVPSSCRRVLDNLVDNALRYAPAGSTIEVRVRHVDHEVEIEVLDRGPGFPPGFLPHAFERFRRADDARSRDSGGAGLGLAIVRSVAERAGGSATAGNRSGGGAAVGVRLPAHNV